MFAANLRRALDTLGAALPQVLIVGGPAGDDELLGVVLRSLPGDVPVGRANVGVARAAVDWLLTVALGAVMAGILGNLYDRLGLWTLPGKTGPTIHAVRDFILVQYPPWTWPNFNLADSSLVCGAALLMWHAFRSNPKPNVQ